MSDQISGRDFGRLEGKVDSVLEGLRAVAATQASHADRLTKLETGNTRRAAFVAGISATISFVVTGIGFYLKHKSEVAG